MPKIYTKLGDRGQTMLGDGRRVSKTALRVEVLGVIDELSTVLGLVHSSKFPVKRPVVGIQKDLMRIGAVVSKYQDQLDLSDRLIFLEKQIDKMQTELPELESFILPGGSPTAAFLHQARAICRRAERRTVELAEQESHQLEKLKPVISYLNRLSDFLFILARQVNLWAGDREERY